MKCTKCGEEKPLSQFWKDRSKKNGRGGGIRKSLY